MIVFDFVKKLTVLAILPCLGALLVNCKIAHRLLLSHNVKVSSPTLRWGHTPEAICLFTITITINQLAWERTTPVCRTAAVAFLVLHSSNITRCHTTHYLELLWYPKGACWVLRYSFYQIILGSFFKATKYFTRIAPNQLTPSVSFWCTESL